MQDVQRPTEAFVLNQERKKPSADPDEWPAFARATSAGGSGQLAVKFKGMPFSGDYNVLATDYGNYTLVYSCTNLLSLAAIEYTWILSRTPTLAEDKIAELIDIVEERTGYSGDSLVFSDQSECGWQ